MSAITADRGGVLVRCPACDKTNRLKYSALASKNQCGSCRSPLKPAARPVEVSDATVHIHELRIERSNIVSYLGKIAPEKQEIALVHALEVGITELIARRERFQR